jgi:cytidine deaminase
MPTDPPTSPDTLLAQARAAAAAAHAPYSRFRVGAALLDAAGRVHPGCNVESASYGLTLCAERVAIFGAIANGAARPFRALAIACVDAAAALGAAGRMPCGACRQVIAEHLPPDALVHVEGAGAFTPAGLLPDPFRLTRDTGADPA